MTRTHLLLWLLTPLAFLLPAAPALAERGVRDDAHFFKSDTINDANRMIDQIYQRHHRDVLIETIAQVPDDQKQELEQQGKEPFFKAWAAKRFHDLQVNGLLILICKDPAHLQLFVGNQTEAHFFPHEDQAELTRQLLGDFRKKEYDQGLLTAVRFIGQRMDAHGARNTGAQRSGGTYTPAPGPSYPIRRHGGWGISGIACFLIAIVLGVILLGSIFGRRGGGTYYGGGQYPPGNYPPGNYPPGGYQPGGYGGGGGGFGRGFLGGLLGGALGGYAAEKWTEHQNQGGGGYVPPPAGDAGGANPDWNVPADTGGTSMGGDFGSDSGGSGGANFGGGGGDFGGGGGDFGGGGGDAGGSTGGDF